ncbi:putative membrane spanning protein [Bacillus thuringiensis MC28]|nr:putative membrane spanning protein [Bacillus thuringiensis MC28]
MEKIIIDILKNDNFLKATPAIVAVIGLLIAGYKQFFKVKTITEIDKLFLDKETTERLKFGKYIFSVIQFFFSYLIVTLYFNFFYYEYLTSDPESLFLSFLKYSLNVFGISFLISSVLFSFQNKLKKHTWFMLIFILSILINLLSSYPLFGYILSLLFSQSDNLYNLYVTLLLLLGLCFFYAHIFSKIQKENHVPYSFRIISEAELKKIKNLIHGYTIDDKRTICFIENILNKEKFYVCDFSSKVYIEYKQLTSQKKEGKSSGSRAKKSKANR